MARIVQLEDIDPGNLLPDEALWLYNGLDCAVTANVWNELQSCRTPAADLSYNFVRAMQAPALEMMLRGLRVDQFMLGHRLRGIERKIESTTKILNQFTDAVWDKELNPNSPAQLKEFFYETMNLPKVERFDKATRSMKVCTDRDALEKLAADYILPRPIISTILAIKDMTKTAGVLRSGVDSDGRMRTSYNITGTETGRWSASKNAFGTGTNLQNITNDLRDIFISDPGTKWAYIDLEQAESRLVAYLSGDEAYIQACEGGDLHTTVATMVWPDLKWSKDPAENREIADTPYYRHFSYRDLAKRGGHGTNYYGKPYTMAKHLKVSKALMEDFQARYFKAFPGITRWHINTRIQLQTKGYIETPLGRVRHFFGRLSDDATLREAIAFVPQSCIGEILNLGLWRVWQYMSQQRIGQPDKVDVMAQLHDAGLFQYSQELEPVILPEIQKLMTVTTQVHGRSMTIPCGGEVGWNWRKFDTKENPDGIKKYKGNDQRTRQTDPQADVFTRRIS